MYYYDEIEVAELSHYLVPAGTKFEANVYSVNSLNVVDGSRLYVKTTMRIMTPEDTGLISGDAVLWRGDRYTLNGYPEPVMQKGEVHHYVCDMERFGG